MIDAHDAGVTDRPRTARFGAHVVTFDPASGTGQEVSPAARKIRGLDDLRRAPILRPAGGPAARAFSGELGLHGELLVAAALASDEQSDRAWSEWCRRTDLTTVDDRARSVLASIADRRGDLGPGEVLRSDLDRYRARVWLRSQLLLHAAGRLARVLDDAGIRCIALKGAAVLHHGRLPLDHRPMNDVDLLVPTAQLGAAVTAALAGDFTAEAGPAPDTLARWTGDLHAIGLDDGAGTAVDLHWHLLAANTRPDADDRVHRRATAVPEQPWLVTSREDTLLHVVVHGVGWTRRPGPRWVLDAAAVAAGAALDWEVVLDEAGRRRLGPVLDTGLDRLARSGVEIPSQVLARARRLGSVVERLELSARASTAVKVAAVASDRRRRGSLAAPSGAPPILAPDVVHPATGPGAPGWLRAGWGAPHPWGTWSRAVAPVLAFTLPEPVAGPLGITLEVVPLIGPGHPAVRVLVFEGRQPVGQWHLSSDGTVAVVLRTRRRRSRAGVRLRLMVLWPCSPTRAGLDDATDHRPLGLRVVGLRWSAG